MKGATWTEPWQVGMGIGAYLAWGSGTVVGALLGGGAFERWPVVDAALGFLMPTLFLSLLLAMMERRHWPVVVVAVGAFALGAVLFSASTGILLGMVAGGLAGALRAPEEATCAPSSWWSASQSGLAPTSSATCPPASAAGRGPAPGARP